MRVTHLVTESGTAARGVPRKVMGTLDAWRRLGIDADALELATGRFVDRADAEAGIASNPAPALRWQWILEMERRGRRLLEVLDRERPDVVYTRELVWSPAIESMFRRHRVVVEINSDSGEELRRRSRAAALYWNASARRLRRRAAGIVAVTGELADRLVPGSVPAAVIGNAADVPSDPPDGPRSTGRPVMVMLVGRAAAWHGLDRFSTLADALPEYEFVVCGDLGCEAASVGPSVRREPACTGDRLGELLGSATAAFSSLALARNQLREACPLKSRACLAAGLPLVYGYVDPALAGDEPFALRLDEAAWNSGPPVDRVRRFLRSVVGDDGLRTSAWSFARDHLDRMSIETRRLEFFRSIIGTAQTAESRGS